MNEREVKETRGAWVVHHGRKIALDVSAPAEFPAIDETAKAAELLVRLGQADTVTLTRQQADAVGKAANLNPRSEVPHYLRILEKRRLIELTDTEVHVIGVTSRSALSHASDLLDSAEPTKFEEAVIQMAEVSSQAPQEAKVVKELVGDTHQLTSADVSDLVNRAVQVGFVDMEGDGESALVFNGNLFKRDSVNKASKVLGSLSSAEQSKMIEFDEVLQRSGCVIGSHADRVLGATLFEKLKAAGLYEVNTVSNEHGEHAFVTAPGAFHKFVNPMIDDSFDMAKALVSALTYGRTLRSGSQGRILSFDWILGALIAGRSIGPATAIGNDYRVLEQNRVVQLIPDGRLYRMKLLKREIGELALQVLKTGDGNATALNEPPAAAMANFQGPEAARVRARRSQKAPSRRATLDILGALRGGRDL